MPATRLPRDSVLSVRRAARDAVFGIVTCALLGTMPAAASPNAVNVRNVGATGNGRADDTVAIQRSIDMAGASGIVYIPCGVYVISASLTLPSGILLRGAGSCAVIKESPLMVDNANWARFTINNKVKIMLTNANWWEDGNSRIIVETLSFDMTAAPPGTSDAIVFYKVSNARVGRIVVQGNAASGGGAADGVAFISSSDYLVEENKVININNACYDNWGGGSEFIIRRNYCDGAKVATSNGILITGVDTENKPETTSDACASNNVIENVGQNGIWAQGGWNMKTGEEATYGSTRNIALAHNRIDNVTQYHGIRVSDSKSTVVDSNFVKGVAASAIIAVSEHEGRQSDVWAINNIVADCAPSDKSPACIVFDRTTSNAYYEEASGNFPTIAGAYSPLIPQERLTMNSLENALCRTERGPR